MGDASRVHNRRRMCRETIFGTWVFLLANQGGSQKMPETRFELMISALLVLRLTNLAIRATLPWPGMKRSSDTAQLVKHPFLRLANFDKITAFIQLTSCEVRVECVVDSMWGIETYCTWQMEPAKDSNMPIRTRKSRDFLE